MKEGTEIGVSRRERLEVTLTALAAAALGIAGPVVALAGRVAWLGPVIALPAGLMLCALWRKLGAEDLGRGLEGAFGRWGGQLGRLAYLGWGLVLLADSGRRYAGRLLTVSDGEAAGWLYLGTALALALWIGRGNGAVFARTGRIFFLTVTVALAVILILALPGLNWKNLWPPEGRDWAGLPAGGALVLSLAGYGIYALCLPRRAEPEMRGWPWAMWGCGFLCAMLLVLVGAFGPNLVGQMEEPFLILLEGVRVPGAFRRGEAAMTALLSLADLVLLILLSRGCMSLWRGIGERWPWVGAVFVSAAFAGAGVLAEKKELAAQVEMILPMGNLVLGVLLPGFAVLLIGLRKRGGQQPIFCGPAGTKKADVAAKSKDEKSCGENEKKC